MQTICSDCRLFCSHHLIIIRTDHHGCTDGQVTLIQIIHISSSKFIEIYHSGYKITTNLITILVFPDYRRRIAAALMPQRSDGNFYRRRSSGDAVYYSCIIISHSNTDHNGFATSQVISVIRCIRFARNFAYHYSMIMRPLCALHSRLNVATSTSWRWFW